MSMCVCLLAHIKLDQLASRRPVQQVRRLGIWAGLVDRGPMLLLLKGYANVHVNRVVGGYAFTSELQSRWVEGDKVTWLSALTWILAVLYVGAVEGSASSAACVARCVSVLRVCVSGTHAQPCCWLNLRTEKHQLHSSAWNRDLRASGQLRLGSSSQARSTLIPRAAVGAAPYNTFLNRHLAQSVVWIGMYTIIYIKFLTY